MKIIILGAGQVGGTLAEHLSGEANDITVVDIDHDLLHALQDRLDIRTVPGIASLPSVLRKAGAEDADMLIAVTNSDETNMIACQIAYTIFRTPTKIARIRAADYFESQEILFKNEYIPIDVLIRPEQLVTDNIRRLIENPGALQVLDFAGGLVQLVAVKAIEGGPLVGHELKDLRQHMPSIDSRVAAIYKKGQAVMPTGNTIVEAGDEAFFIADHNHIREVMSELRRLEQPYKRIIIAGGGNIGAGLAKQIEHDYSVKIIELSEERCYKLSAQLDKTIVLNGSASDQELLMDENIEDTDVFCALTNDDEANIMSSLLAKRLGAKKVMALIGRPAYVDLVQGGDIDIAISPQQTTISALLTHVRRGDIVNVHSLRRGAAEAIEVIAHGDQKTSRVVGRAIEEIDLPDGCTIGALVREDENGTPNVLIAHHDLVIQPEDHVIVFLTNKQKMNDVEQLFQVGFSFF
jgi:trk system potassium uptake protein TrkA